MYLLTFVRRRIYCFIKHKILHINKTLIILTMIKDLEYDYFEEINYSRNK